MRFIHLKYETNYDQTPTKNTSFLLLNLLHFIVNLLLKTPSKAMKRAAEKHLSIFHQKSNDTLLNTLNLKQFFMQYYDNKNHKKDKENERLNTA